MSVVIPVFNGADYLREAIDSALAQTWPNVEVIVVDDGSTDDGATIRVASAFGDRIRLIRQEHRGVSAALNIGIEVMTGDAFAWLSHDDIYLPQKLERQVEALRASGGEAVIYTDYELVAADRQRIKTKRMSNIAPGGFRVWMLAESGLHGCTVLVPRSHLRDDRFDERLATTQDYEMWFRLAGRHPFVRVPEVLLRYRIHGRQGSWIHPDAVEEGDRLYIGFLDQVGLDEIRSGTHLSPSVIYARAAARLKFRGYPAAAARARDLSDRQARSIGDRLDPRRLAALIAFRIAHPNLRPMGWWKRRHLRPPPQRLIDPDR